MTAKTTKKSTTKPARPSVKKKTAKSTRSRSSRQAVKQAPEEVQPTPPPKKIIRKPQMIVGFTDFLREQSVVGMAVGLVIGVQVKAVTDQLIASFINPLIGLVLPGTGSLDQKLFVLHIGKKSAQFAWGSFVAVMLSFIATAAVVYFIFKALKLDKLTKKKDA